MSPSRLLADDAPEIRSQLSSITGEALGGLSLDLVTVSGGVEVSFRKPSLKIIGPWK
ncbi:hypothetical protein [Streptomyces jumonjinensis]|uniref:hypothetical protein n=1 Tax=Streptomyces jumonjinensis TaxID=1945 RepID=UPI0037A9538F